MKIDNSEVVWLAGLLEGEGSFGIDTRDNFVYPMIYLNMCDRDVVEHANRVMQILGGGRKRSVTWKAGSSTCKPQWRSNACGKPAANIMRAILPYMGERRTERIKDVLAAYDAHLASMVAEPYVHKNGRFASKRV